MIAIVTTPERIDQVREAARKLDDIAFEQSSKELDPAGMRSVFDAVSRVAADIFIVDIEIGTGSDFISGLRNYRISRPQARVIVLAPERKPGDHIISRIVQLGVYDIIDDEPGIDWSVIVTKVLQKSPATFSEAVRWHVSVPEEDRNIGKNVIIERRPIGMIYIAVAGISPGVGATHTAISIAAYLARKKHAIALTEVSSRPGFGVMASVLNAGQGKVNNSWRLENIDIYSMPSNAEKEIWRIYERYLVQFKGRYNYLVTDLGELNSNTKIELLRASVPVIVTSAAPWRLSELQQSLDAEYTDFCILINQPGPDYIKLLQRTHNMTAFILPHIQDPLNPKEGEQVLGELLNPVLPQSVKKQNFFPFFNFMRRNSG